MEYVAAVVVIAALIGFIAYRVVKNDSKKGGSTGGAGGPGETHQK